MCRKSVCTRSSRELATSWAWNEDGTELTFQLRRGVKWHDGKPFTAEDVDVHLGLLIRTRRREKLRVNPRKSTYDNVDRVTMNGDFEVTFHLKRSQPAFPMLLAGGFILRSIRATCRRRKCAPIRSAPGHSSLSNSSRTRSCQGSPQSRLLETRPAVSRWH